MATETIEGYFSAPAAADFSDGSYQYRAVVYNSAGNVALAGADSNPDGILKNEPKAGEQARFEFWTGVHKARAGAAIARGALLNIDANGQFITAVSGKTARYKAIDAASKAGIIFRVKPISAQLVA